MTTVVLYVFLVSREQSATDCTVAICPENLNIFDKRSIKLLLGNIVKFPVLPFIKSPS